MVGSVQLYLAARRRGEDPGARLEAAWYRFHGTYGPLVRRLAAARCPIGYEPEDCVQEVWYRLVTCLRRYRCDGPPGTFRVWLRVLVRHVLADLVRGHRPTTSLDPVVAGTLAGREPDPVTASEVAELAVLVRHGLEVLRPRVAPASFQVLCLQSLEGWSAHEIAATLGLSPGLVRVRHHRTLRTFGRVFREQVGRAGAGGGEFSPDFL